MNFTSEKDSKVNDDASKESNQQFSRVKSYPIILTIVSFLSMISLASACSGCLFYTTYQLSDNSLAKSCDGVCNGSCANYPYVKMKTKTGTIIDWKQCYNCACSSALTYYPITSPPGSHQGSYSCDTSCTTPNCWRQYQGIINSNNIYFCVGCPGNCTCLNSTYCVTCYDGYYALPSTTLCPKCDQLWGGGCATCDYTKCFTCAGGWAFDLNKTKSTVNCCFLCTNIPNCATCIDGPICTSCVLGGNFNLTTTLPQKQCILCKVYIPNCSACMDGISCISCVSGYALNYTNATIPQSCILCTTIQHCATCVDGPVCTDCVVGYFLNRSTLPTPSCLPCSTIPNCVGCLTNQPLCTSCFPDTFIDYATIYDECIYCLIAHCITCANGPICLLCTTNFIPDPITEFHTCVSCPPDSFSLNNLCYKCNTVINKCTSCYHNGIQVNCTSCESTAVVDPRTLGCFDCSNIIPYCSACTDIYTCIDCRYPYILGPSGKCDVCEEGFQFLDNLCIKPQGCQNSVPDYSRCISCFPNYNFVYDEKSQSCICKVGYKLFNLNRALICINDCGDSITSQPDEDCDDGNNRDGDGCGSTCKRQQNFFCTITEPSQCTLHLNVTQLKYNYAYRIEGKNRGKFSFSVFPFHSMFQYVDWGKYLSLNISINFLIPESVTYGYIYATNQITLEFDYKQTLENLVTRATLSFSKNPARLLQTNSNYFADLTKVSTTILSTSPDIFSVPDSLSLEITLNGVNAMLAFDDEGMLQAYKGASTSFMIIGVIILLLFLGGSYSHKMIGLETIQIIQFCYFMVMIVNQKTASFLKTLNLLKYTAFGGYSDYELFYGDIEQEAKSITSFLVDQSFRFVGLLKYFTLNVNMSLIMPLLALIIYTIFMIRKFKKRSEYLETRQQHIKDEYTAMMRSAQWIYDHCMFPVINLFSMIAFFCTVMELQLSSENGIQTSSMMKVVEKTSFIPHLIILFLTFFMFDFEMFASYKHYLYQRLTPQQKQRVPSSTLEKLQHDANNPDRENYKPGYILVYLFFYLMVEITLTINVLWHQVSDYGTDLILILCFVYLVIIWRWQPYHSSVNFHNRALKLNHLTAFLFALICQILNRFAVSQMVAVVMVYFIFVMLILVSLGCCIRLYLEYKFRQKLEDDPGLLENYKKQEDVEPDELTKKQKMLINNKFSFQHQINKVYNVQKLQNLSFVPHQDQQVQKIKKQVRKEIYSKKNFRIDIENDLFMEEILQEQCMMKKITLSQNFYE